MSRKYNKKDTTSENIENFLDKLDIDLANVEKFGSTLLAIGYLLFIKGSDLDILDTLDINNTGLTSTSVTLEGAKLILIGYIALFLVAEYRLDEKVFRKDVTDEKIILSPYIKLFYAYFISILVNVVRIDALAELDYINRSSESFV